MARARDGSADDSDPDFDSDPDWGAGDSDPEYDPDDPETYPDGVYADGDERPVVPCPYCRAEIDAESEQCPKCGTYISGEDAPPAPPSRTFAVLLVLALVAALFLAVTR